MKKLFSLIALITVLLGAVAAQTPITIPRPAPAAAANNVQLVIDGTVIGVHDGDTVTVLDQDHKKFTIRLQGIDAPELKQEFGQAAQKNLSEMVLGKQVSIVWTKVDKYRRTVGTIMLDSRDINIEQVKAGVAWHYKKYEDEQSPTDRVTYAAAELEARAARLGLWKNADPTPPGDWRQETKAKRWGPPPPEGTIIGSDNSKKYHRPDCPGYRDMAERNRVFFKSVSEAEAAGFKRAGNCPAEIVSLKPSPPQAIAAVTAASSNAEATKTVSTPQPTARAEVIIDPLAPPRDRTSALASMKTVGNKNSKVYHLPGCPGYDRVSEKNRVLFDGASAAEQAGYRRAGNCSEESVALKPPSSSPTASVVSEAEVIKPTIPATPESRPAPPQAAVIRSEPTTPTGEQVASTSMKLVGNKNSKIFHLPGCPGYDRVSEKNRVFFESSAEAEKAGYRLAKNCSASGSE